MHLSLNICYSNNENELTNLSKKYNECCKIPLTFLYNSFFDNYRYINYSIAELTREKNKLDLWSNYFINSKIYNFPSDNISSKFVSMNKLKQQFHVIFGTNSGIFNEQIEIIKNTGKFLKPGGLLLIDNINTNIDENIYFNTLNNVFKENYQKYYFATINDKNDKLRENETKVLILIKNGEEPIFKNKNKITIITPSYRIDNLPKLRESIDFTYVDEWIIVYDGIKINNYPILFENDLHKYKIKQFIHKGIGISGNPQRNYGITKVTNENTFIYYLDDDNIIHPNLYALLDIIDNNNKIYTFNQRRPRDIYPYVELLKGNSIALFQIDTAMFLIHFSLCKETDWILDKYNADGYYIIECFNKNKKNHIYIDNELAYYNKI
jgi:hypothetical protein